MKFGPDEIYPVARDFFYFKQALWRIWERRSLHQLQEKKWVLDQSTEHGQDDQFKLNPDNTNAKEMLKKLEKK